MAEKNDPDCEEIEKQSFFNTCFGPAGIRTEGKWYNIHLGGRFFFLIGAMFVSFIAFSGYMFNYSTKPEFCRTCHIMDPYYDAWETSTHKEVATCVDCHYPKGMGILPQKMRAMSQLVQYITRTYRPRPRAEVPDANCLQGGCHETRLLQGKIVSEKGIIFDHTPHLTEVRRGKQLQCTSCHSQMVIGKHIEVTTSTCYLCHFKGHQPSRTEKPLAGCTSCHAPPSEPIQLTDGGKFRHADYVERPGVKCLDCHLDSIAGDGPAPKERCYACHNRPERIKEYENIDFVHKNHVAEHKIECGACHLEIKHEIGAAKQETGSCAQCHNSGHDTVTMMYEGNWPGTETAQPSSMSKAHVQCIACHTKKDEDGISTPMPFHFDADPEACDRCHDEGFGDFIGQWKEDIDGTLTEIEAKIKSLETTLESTSENKQRRSEIEQLLLQARRDVLFTRSGRGVHNYDLTSERLIKLNKLLDASLIAQSN